jgi:hypothetical protein
VCNTCWVQINHNLLIHSIIIGVILIGEARLHGGRNRDNRSQLQHMGIRIVETNQGSTAGDYQTYRNCWSSGNIDRGGRILIPHRSRFPRVLSGQQIALLGLAHAAHSDCHGSNLGLAQLAGSQRGQRQGWRPRSWAWAEAGRAQHGGERRRCCHRLLQ